MKKVFLSALLIASTLLVVGQELTTAEIAKVINLSKEANQKNGVNDPNLIHPGQTLTFLFTDGSEHAVTVENGDSQWKILKDKIANLIKMHGEIVEPNQSQVPGQKVVPDSTTTTVATNKNNLSWIGWALVIIACILLAIFLDRQIKKGQVRKEIREDAEARKNPITSGTPMRRNGVTDEQARMYVQQVATRMYPQGTTFTVSNVERGRLSGTNVAVFYAGSEEPQRKIFENVAAYRGTIRRGETDEVVYFLQGCGNDVRVGNYFSGAEISFVPDSQQPPVLRPAQTEPVKIVQSPAETVAHDPALVELVKATTALTAPFAGKDWGKVVIETGNGEEKTKVEIHFGTGQKPKNSEVAAEPAGNNSEVK